MSCPPVVLGATCDDAINYGETIDLLFTYLNEDGTPTDLTTSTVAIFSSTPDVIKERATVTITDPTAGKVRFLLHRDDALNLRMGRSNSFRLQMIYGAESDDVTPEIYLQVE